MAYMDSLWADSFGGVVTDRGDGVLVRRFGDDCNHGQSNQSKNEVGQIANLAAMAIAAINTGAAIYTADKQYELAKRYSRIAKWWRDYYNSTYAPWENQELEEAKSLVPVDPIYDTAVGRAKTFARIQFNDLAARSIQCTGAHCTGLRGALLKDVLTSEASALSAAANLGYRNERAYVEARNDNDWAKKIAVVNRGRGLLAEHINFGVLSFGIFGDLGAQAAQAAGGAIGYLGYVWNRNETVYPTLYRGYTEQRSASTPEETSLVAANVPLSGVYFAEGSGVGYARGYKPAGGN